MWVCVHIKVCVHINCLHITLNCHEDIYLSVGLSVKLCFLLVFTSYIPPPKKKFNGLPLSIRMSFHNHILKTVALVTFYFPHIFSRLPFPVASYVWVVGTSTPQTPWQRSTRWLPDNQQWYRSTHQRAGLLCCCRSWHLEVRPQKIIVVLIRNKLKTDEGERSSSFFFLKLKNNCLGSHQKKIEKLLWRPKIPYHQKNASISRVFPKTEYLTRNVTLFFCL